MARPNKIWYWKEKKSYFVTIDGKRHNLGKDEDKAKKEFHRLMSLPEAKAPSKVVGGYVTAVELLEKFLLWTEKNRSPATDKWYNKHLQAFLDSLPNQFILASDVRPHHVTDWVKSTWSNSYKRGAMVAVSRAFKWGKRQGYIDSELTLEKPAAERRDNCPTQADYDLMLTHATEPFKSVLKFAFETGARPQEIVKIKPEYCKADRIEFPVAESKGKKKKRVIYLTDKAQEIIKEASLCNSGGTIFTNRNGKPWTAYSIDCRMKRIAEKTGKKFCLTDLRHFFCSRMLMAGIDHITTSKLMGHSTAAMVVAQYEHIGDNTDRLAERLKSVQ